MSAVSSKQENSLTSPCDGCAYGKSQRKSFPTDGRSRGTKIGDLIHSDICGPMNVTSPGGARYFISFKDGFSGFRVVYFMKEKLEVLQHFEQFMHRLEGETRQRISTLRSDNGGEYMRKFFND